LEIVVEEIGIGDEALGAKEIVGDQARCELVDGFDRQPQRGMASAGSELDRSNHMRSTRSACRGG
jgi:hypothetical protein